MFEKANAAIFKALLGENPDPPTPQRPFLPPATPGDLNLPEAPGVQVDDPTGRLSGKYDGTTMRNIVAAARRSRVDPLTALAISGQESTFGRQAPANPMQIRFDLHPGTEPAAGPEGLRQEEALQAAMRVFKTLTGRQRKRTPDDPELILQSYNGLGKIHGGSEVADDQPMYGGQTGLHGAKDRPYGKAILQLREMLKGQKAIQQLLDPHK